jgi:hypothetical protein
VVEEPVVEEPVVAALVVVLELLGVEPPLVAVVSAGSAE